MIKVSDGGVYRVRHLLWGLRLLGIISAETDRKVMDFMWARSDAQEELVRVRDQDT